MYLVQCRDPARQGWEGWFEESAGNICDGHTEGEGEGGGEGEGEGEGERGSLTSSMTCCRGFA